MWPVSVEFKNASIRDVWWLMVLIALLNLALLLGALALATLVVRAVWCA
jgi:hypothetical protein